MGGEWLKIAIEDGQAMQAEQAGQQAGQQAHPLQPTVPDGNQKEDAAAVEPKPMPTPNQKADAGKRQRSQMDAIRNVVLPDAARRALPALNQSLHFLVGELMSRDDLRLDEASARNVAIGIMGVWLNASRTGTVSDLGSLVARSGAIDEIAGIG